jgi:hypothetical protein
MTFLHLAVSLARVLVAAFVVVVTPLAAPKQTAANDPVPDL